MGDVYGITTRKTYGVAHLFLSGSVDIAAVDDLRIAISQALADPVPTAVLIDLAEASFIDSSVVRVLVAGKHAARQECTVFTVARPHGMVEQVLKVTGVYDTLTATGG